MKIHSGDSVWAQDQHYVWGMRLIDIHIWGDIEFIHTIHSPYYYYESISYLYTP